MSKVPFTDSAFTAAYNVALNEQHFRDLFLEATTPPVTRSAKESDSSLLMMGFPSRIFETYASLCACHSKLTKGGYLCSRCTSKVCSLPCECPACGLTLILSTHLARSYHHLFPLINWVEVPWRRASKSTRCFACQTPFPPVPKDHHALAAPDTAAKTTTSGTSPSSRYECSACGNHFCIDCDVWSHEVVHNCPGCQSLAPSSSGATAVVASNGQDQGAGGEANGEDPNSMDLG